MQYRFTNSCKLSGSPEEFSLRLTGAYLLTTSCNRNRYVNCNRSETRMVLTRHRMHGSSHLIPKVTHYNREREVSPLHHQVTHCTTKSPQGILDLRRFLLPSLLLIVIIMIIVMKSKSPDKIHLPRRKLNQSPVSGFCYAGTRVRNAV